MLDAHQLNVFLVAAQTLNFSEAARRLSMTQPCVSQHIQSLERRFETQLFERKGRHLSLTAAGQALLPMARRLVNESINIQETMASLRGEVFGHLAIGCASSTARSLLPRILAGFHAQHPNVQVTCRMTDLRTALDLLSEAKLHLAFTSDRDLRKELDYVYMSADRVVLVVPPDHPWAAQDWIEPHELRQARFIFREPTCGTCKAVAEALAKVGLNYDQLDTVMTLCTAQAVALAVRGGVGVAFVSRIVVEPDLAEGALVEVRVRGLEVLKDLWIVRNTHQPPTRAQAAFWDFATDLENRMSAVLPRNRLPPGPFCTISSPDVLAGVD